MTFKKVLFIDRDVGGFCGAGLHHDQNVLCWVSLSSQYSRQQSILPIQLPTKATPTFLTFLSIFREHYYLKLCADFHNVKRIDDDDNTCACMRLYSRWVGSEVLGYLQNTAPVTLARTQSVMIIVIIVVFATITI